MVAANPVQRAPHIVWAAAAENSLATARRAALVTSSVAAPNVASLVRFVVRSTEEGPWGGLPAIGATVLPVVHRVIEPQGSLNVHPIVTSDPIKIEQGVLSVKFGCCRLQCLSFFVLTTESTGEDDVMLFNGRG